MSAHAPQVLSARRMYDSRAANYEDGWYPKYAKRFIEHSSLKPGQRVLDLCCGTGFDAFLAAEIVGDKGDVICVDVSDGMLAVARERQANDPVLGPRMQFINHDVTSLDGIPTVKKGSFDAILCSNAFVFLLNPQAVVKTWREFLKPGGFMVIDVPHERNVPSGIFLEQAAKNLGVENFPSSRVWIKSKDSFPEMLEAEGFAVQDIIELQKVTNQSSAYLTNDQADEQYDRIAKTGLTLHVMEQSSRFREEGKQAFKDKFAKAAVDGKVEIDDTIYVYVARKA